MNAARSADGGPAALTLRAPAKVNLFLEVAGKRPDGYHEIATLMVAVSLYDTLEFAPAPTVDHADLLRPRPVHRAGEPGRAGRGTAAAAHRDARPGRTIRLTKRIPMEAGLAADRATRRRRWSG